MIEMAPKGSDGDRIVRDVCSFDINIVKVWSFNTIPFKNHNDYALTIQQLILYPLFLNWFSINQNVRNITLMLLSS